jgi:hypothetical protein
VLTADERAWVLHSEALWRKATEIAEEDPAVDVSDVYHVLRNLELPPAQRLRNGLTRVRVLRRRPHAG